MKAAQTEKHSQSLLFIQQNEHNLNKLAHSTSHQNEQPHHGKAMLKIQMLEQIMNNENSDDEKSQVNSIDENDEGLGDHVDYFARRRSPSKR